MELESFANVPIISAKTGLSSYIEYKVIPSQLSIYFAAHLKIMFVNFTTPLSAPSLTFVV